MSQAHIQLASRWNGTDKRTFPAFQRSFRTELASRKILWTIQEDDPSTVPKKPINSLIKIADASATDVDLRIVDKYEKLVKTRKEECEQAIAVLERAAGPVPLSRIDDILSSQRDPRAVIKAAYEKLVMLYSTKTEDLVDRIEGELFNLPCATTANEVISLLDNMIALNAEIRGIDRGSVWTDGQMKKQLNKRVSLPAFAACKDRCSFENADWTKTEYEFRLVAEREGGLISTRDVRTTPRQGKLSDGSSMQEFSSTIAAAIVNHSSQSPRLCWNCNQSGHYVKECQLGMCRNCSTKGEKSNHNPGDCPRYVPKSRDREKRSHGSTTIHGAFKGQPFQAKINAVTEDDHREKRPRVDNVDNVEESLWDKIKMGNLDSGSESNYESSYRHPLSITISEDTVKLICHISVSRPDDKLTTNYRVLLDSGASISLCNIDIAKKFRLKVHKLKKPIPLKFGNNSTGHSHFWCHCGALLGAIYIVQGLAMTLISTTELARRNITFYNAKNPLVLSIGTTKRSSFTNTTPRLNFQS